MMAISGRSTGSGIFCLTLSVEDDLKKFHRSAENGQQVKGAEGSQVPNYFWASLCSTGKKSSG
jgi:hypothetical protein